MKAIKTTFKERIEKQVILFKDYQLDLKKLLFNFIMGYASILIVILLLALSGHSLKNLIFDHTILYGILGCCSSLLAVSSIVIQKYNQSIAYIPFMYNVVVILPVIGFLTYSIQINEFEVSAKGLFIIAMVGVIISFYYLTKNTNRDRNIRLKEIEMEKEAEKLRELSKGNNSSVEFGEKEVKY